MFKIREFICWNEITGAPIYILHPETYATREGAQAGMERLVNRYTSKGSRPGGLEIVPFITGL